jgi:tetratricopeptide (TPR) repeat protein
MKRNLPLLIIILVAVYMTTTGFQCGSAETTSAKLYMQQKNWQKAEESLMKEIVKNDKNEEAHFMLGQVRFEVKNYEGMNESFSKALQLSDQHKQDIMRYRLSVWGTLFNEGVAYYNKGRDSAVYYDKALKLFNTAIQTEPDSSTTYYVAALAHFSNKEMPAAIGKLETAVQKDPKYSDAIRLLGQFYTVTAGEKADAKDDAGAKAYQEKATQMFERAYQLDPNNGDIIKTLIDSYERSKQVSKAMALTSEAVKKEPDNKVFRYAYGAFLLKQEKYKESVEQFDAALKIDPNYSDAEYNLGVAYLNWGVFMKEEADKKYEAERKANKGKEVKEDMSYKEKFKSAVPYLEKAAQVRQDDPLLWQTLAKVYANLSMTDKARAAFEKFDKLTKGK